MAYTTINKSTDYFNTKLFVGNSSTNAITGVGFQPDWTWLKSRSGANDHQLYDAVRTATKYLRAESSDAEGTASTGLTAFNSDGFTLGSAGTTNVSGGSMASWNWKAGGGQGSSNTDGSINTTYTSANTTAGFSISKWTGNGSTATIGHGLGAVPRMIMVKSLANSTTWMVQHSSLGNAKEIYLNNNSAAGNSTAWNSTDPTSTVFTVTGGAGDGVNASGDYIAYCFAEKTGFSKFGSYTGNGNANGPFIFCGFKPAFILLKQTSSAGNDWWMFDNKRLGFNPSNSLLRASISNAELANTDIDLVSNGFKIVSTDGGINASGSTYIYMAFAEAPLVGSNNVPCTAR